MAAATKTNFTKKRGAKNVFTMFHPGKVTTYKVDRSKSLCCHEQRMKFVQHISTPPNNPCKVDNAC